MHKKLLVCFSLFLSAPIITTWVMAADSTQDQDIAPTTSSSLPHSIEQSALQFEVDQDSLEEMEKLKKEFYETIAPKLAGEAKEIEDEIIGQERYLDRDRKGPFGIGQFVTYNEKWKTRDVTRKQGYFNIRFNIERSLEGGKEVNLSFAADTLPFYLCDLLVHLCSKGSDMGVFSPIKELFPVPVCPYFSVSETTLTINPAATMQVYYGIQEILKSKQPNRDVLALSTMLEIFWKEKTSNLLR